jgi:signal peptidase II
VSWFDARLRLAASVAALVVVADQVTKAIVPRVLALHETVPVTPFFAFTYVRNTGAAFGLLAAAPPSLRVPLFLTVTVVAVGALVSYLRQTPPSHRWMVSALGGILGGAVGNLICRIRYGEVIDFLLLHWGDLQWPVFNVADSAITLGVGVILARSLLGEERREDPQ